MNYSDRQRKLQSEILRQDLEGCLISHLPNIRYLTGFSGSSAMLLLTADAVLFFTDGRYRWQARHQVKAELRVAERSLEEAVVATVRELGLRRVGFESGRLTFKRHRQLVDSLEGRVEWVPGEDLVEGFRVVKAQEEVDALRQAIELTWHVFHRFREEIRRGRRERELASILEFDLRRAGAEKLAFDTIIASGPRAAMPHGVASEKEVQINEFVVCDFGIVLDGYCSDLTRTVYVGEPDERAREIYEIVLAAQTHCETHLRAGMDCHVADALTRDVIASRGYGEYYGHGTGHGVGLEVHEAPRIGKHASSSVPQGAVVTVEPGIYLPDWGGVRIEDMVLVTETGAEVLTPGSKELVSLPV